MKKGRKKKKIGEFIVDVVVDENGMFWERFLYDVYCKFYFL